MDFKALMTKLEQIDKKEILNESVVQPKKVVKNHINENIDLKSSIARALMQEFGVNEAEDDKTTGDDARPETGNEPGGTQQSAPQAQDEFAGVDSAIGQQATQAAADANPEVYGYGGGQAAPQAAQQPAAGSQADDAFQQANQEPSQDDPAQGGDAIGQAQAATQPIAQPTAQTQPAAPAAQPAAQPAQAAPAKPAAPAAGGWQALYAANKAVIGPNPNMIKPGQVLTMPDSKKYTVAPGDTLSAIAAGKFKGKPPAQEQQDESLNLIRKLAGL